MCWLSFSSPNECWTSLERRDLSRQCFQAYCILNAQAYRLSLLMVFPTFR